MAVSIESKAYPRSARLTKPIEFKAVFRKPLVSSDHCFKILARLAGDVTSARLGLAVSKKVDKRAVARNRIKRIVRESFRSEVLPAGESQSEYRKLDYVVLPRATCVTLSNQQLFESLGKHWHGLQKKACQMKIEDERE